MQFLLYMTGEALEVTAAHAEHQQQAPTHVQVETSTVQVTTQCEETLTQQLSGIHAVQL